MACGRDEGRMVEYRRFFIESRELSGEEVRLRGDEHRHLANVLRMRPGERAVLCTGDGIDILCEIVSVGKAETVLRVLRREKNKCEFGTDITLFQAVLKGDKTELVIQKAVELGAGKIVLFESEHTVAKTNGKEERYSRIALEAAKQCGRSVITSVGIMSYDEVVGSIDEYGTAIFCNERDDTTPILRFLTKHGIKGNVCIIVGAEGGFSEEEAAELSEKANSVTLGKRILRAETASICALSVMGAFMDLSDR